MVNSIRGDKGSRQSSMPWTGADKGNVLKTRDLVCGRGDFVMNDVEFELMRTLISKQSGLC